MILNPGTRVILKNRVGKGWVPAMDKFKGKLVTLKTTIFVDRQSDFRIEEARQWIFDYEDIDWEKQSYDFKSRTTYYIT